MPPSEPPITAASCCTPSASSRRACAFTQSSTVSTGKSLPHARPVAGLMCMGPVEPKQEPGLFTPMTKKRFVSTGSPGPTMFAHQPALLLLPAYSPATWCEALSAWQMSTALLRAAFSSP